ncbi:hypothetical protein MJO28_007242 [Puccinia striiformis f. sp. tritici]|uniref:Uncharacterized protein n=1 Tax=Puccinia striiformis f. sp. tritici TaxID=168172 RepID=A0ACC0EDC2_9BASI|nr:hypothetical protein MJO28_007242 [Puccinia striiformis f. sp. tritici]
MQVAMQSQFSRAVHFYLRTAKLRQPTHWQLRKRMTSSTAPMLAENEGKGLSQPPRPDINDGLAYWNSIAKQDSITNNGVLGGFGNGSLPRVDAMGSRMFLLTIRPELSIIKPPYTPTNPSPETNQETTRTKGDRRLYRALDVGAGIGRVTSDVLLYLFDRIDLVEPVAGFIETAKRNASSGKWSQLLQLQENSLSSKDTDIIQSDPSSKGVRFWKKSIQAFEPSTAIAHQSSTSASPIIMISDDCSIVGSKDGWNDGCGYDVIWAQWTLGHLSDEELIEFLKKCKDALRKPSRTRRCPPHHTSTSTSSVSSFDSTNQVIDSPNNDEEVQEEDDELVGPSFERDGGLIIIKENIYVCQSDPDGDTFSFDKEDSSLTRSHPSFLRIFNQAGLRLIKQEVQRGFDPDLYKVNFYALQ